MSIGLVLEGGGTRGMYTAGVLDVLMDKGIEADKIVGASAGALFGVNFLSKQRGRAFVIRPSVPVEVGRLEGDPDKLQAAYDLGVKDTENILEKLMEYIRA